MTYSCLPSKFRSLAESNRINRVRFIESGCSPIVIDCERSSDGRHELLTSPSGETITCNNLANAYEICRSVGLHSAELVHTIPHDEACAGEYCKAEPQSMQLYF